MADGAEAGAQAQSRDTPVELDAAAVLEAFEELEEALGLREAVPHFGDFAGGELAPAGGDRRVFAETVEEEFDFCEGEIHFAGEADEQDTVEGVGGVAALAADAVRC